MEFLLWPPPLNFHGLESLVDKRRAFHAISSSLPQKDTWAYVGAGWLTWRATQPVVHVGPISGPEKILAHGTWYPASTAGTDMVFYQQLELFGFLQ